MEKLFSAKVVTLNSKGLGPFAIGGIGFVFAFIALLYEPLQQYTAYLFFAVMIVTIIAFFVLRGDIEGYDLKKELFVFANHLEIDKLLFPFNETANLKFTFKAFQDMKEFAYQPDPNANFEEYPNTGMDNTISFHYKKQSFDYCFHVQSQQHFYQFVQMLEQLYINHTTFLEKNWYGKTFLMQNVTDEQYDVLISKYQ